MSPWYAVFVGFVAKAMASALVANHARSVPLDRRQRFCEFNVPPPIQRLPCEGLCNLGKSSSPLACGLVALGISGMLGALSSCAVWHAHSYSSIHGNFVYLHFRVVTGQGYRREVRGHGCSASLLYWWHTSIHPLLWLDDGRIRVGLLPHHCLSDHFESRTERDAEVSS